MRIKQLFRKLMKEIDIMKFNKTNNISLEDFLNKDLGLDEFQESYAEEASYRALNNPKGFDTLDGKGGVGKTVTQTRVAQHLLRRNKKILVLAPTHKALDVLRSKLNIETNLLRFATVAKATKATRSLSSINGELNFYANSLELNEADAVMLDEGSFVDDREIKAILGGTLTSEVRLLVSGDACQLPKPKSNKISMFMDKRSAHNPKRNCYITTLTKVYRTEGKGILLFSDFIRNQWVIPERRGLTFNTVLSSILKVAKHYPDVHIYNKNKENMKYMHELIAAKKGSIVYIAYKNAVIDELAAYNIEREYRKGVADNPYFPKKSLWYTTAPLYNEDTALLQNGQYVYVSGIHKIEERDYHDYTFRVVSLEVQTTSKPARRLFVDVVHPEDKVFYDMLMDSFDVEANNTTNKKEKKLIWKQKNDIRESFLHIKHASFFTAHKSQGSEYPVVIIDLKDVLSITSTFVKNKAFYVAVSRARKHLIFLI